MTTMYPSESLEVRRLRFFDLLVQVGTEVEWAERVARRSFESEIQAERNLEVEIFLMRASLRIERAVQ